MNGDGVRFFDTNILVYSEEGPTTEKGRIAGALVSRCIETGQGRLSSQVLGEYFVTVTRKIKTPLDQETARRRVELLSCMPVVAIDAPMVLAAIGAMLRYGISYWDSQILAAAAASGATVLYSEDLNSGQEYLGLKVENPFASA